MSELSKQVNRFFDNSTKSEIDDILSQIYITDHQKNVLIMRYLDQYDINYIAYKTGYSRGKIEADLRKIRKKLSKLI